MPVTAQRRFDAPPQAKSPRCARLQGRPGQSFRFQLVVGPADQVKSDPPAPNQPRSAESTARSVPVFERRPRQFPPYAALDNRCSTITASAPTAA